MDLKFKNPATYIISGATGCGKTTFVKKLIKHKQEMFEFPPQGILYIYGVWQDGFEELEKQYNIEFHKGLPDEEILQPYYNNKFHTLILIDDLMSDSAGSKNIHELFYKDSHHTNTSCMLLIQNLFAKNLRGISLNGQYFILFRSPREIGQISTFGSQLGMSKLLKEAYLDACKEPYSYLLVDLHPTTDPKFALRAKIFTPFEDTIVYRE